MPTAVPALQSPALCFFPWLHQLHQWYAARIAGWAPEGWRGRGTGWPAARSPSPRLPTGTPHALIVRRYLSLLDTAVELELPGYRGPRLPRRQQVPIFPQPLITDRARCKYRWMGQPGVRGGASLGAAEWKSQRDHEAKAKELSATIKLGPEAAEGFTQGGGTRLGQTRMRCRALPATGVLSPQSQGHSS